MTISQKLITSFRAMTPTQKLLTSGGILLGGVAAVVAGLWVHQRRLVYQPGGPALPPAEVGLDDAEPVAFTTEDGLSLARWFVPGHRPDPLGAVIVFHGKGCNRSQRAQLAKALAGAGLDVLLFDYRLARMPQGLVSLCLRRSIRALTPSAGDRQQIGNAPANTGEHVALLDSTEHPRNQRERCCAPPAREMIPH